MAVARATASGPGVMTKKNDPEGREQMTVSAQQVNELRKKTDAGVMECKKALEEAKGDITKAEDILRIRGQKKAESKVGRETKEGTILSYIHAGGKVGVLVELACETDFVAKNAQFQDLAKDVAMQIAAMKPKYVSREAIPADLLDKEKALFKEEAAKTGKPANVLDRIVDGKLEKWYEENCLIDQVFIKDDKVKIKDLIKAVVAKVGENITVRRFARFQVGEALQ